MQLVAQIDKEISIEDVDAYVQEHFFNNLNLTNSSIQRPYVLYETDEHIIFELDQHNNINQLDHHVLLNTGGTFSSHTNRYPFYEKKRVEIDIKIPETMGKGYLTQQYFTGEDVDVKINVSLPYKIKDHNANTAEENEKSLTWNIDPVNDNKLEFTYVNNEIYKFVFIALLLICAIIIYFVKKSKDQKNKV